MAIYFKFFTYGIARIVNLAGISKPATFDNSKIRFGLLKKLLGFSAYTVFKKGLYISAENNKSDESFNDDFYYEHLYYIQNSPKSFLGQAIMAVDLVRVAISFNKSFQPCELEKINLKGNSQKIM